MYQMLIVDDNNKDRRVLREIINWNSYDIEIIGEASNGREALKQIGVCRPDIIITDIYMPVMNGLDLVAEIRKSYDDVKIIFMSFYEDFEFAKSAIDLSVYGYIVKPIRRAEVEQAMSKVLTVHKREEKDKEEKNLLNQNLEKAMPILKESFFRDLIFGVYNNEEDVLKRMEYFRIPRFRNQNLMVFTILVKNMSLETSVMQQYSTVYSLQELLTVSSGTVLAYVIQTSTDEYAVLRILDREEKNNTEQEEINYIMDVYSRLETILLNDFVIGISLPSQRITDIHTMYKQARKAAATLYSRKIPVVLYKDIIDSSSDQTANQIHFDEIYNQIGELLMGNNDQDILDFLNDIFATASRDGNQYTRYQAHSIVNILQIHILEHRKNIKEIIKDDVVWKKLNKISAIDELVDLLYKTMIKVKNSIHDYTLSRNDQIVEDIINFIHERYSEQISINDITQSVYMSSKQANNIFKKKMGLSIFEYLVAYRIRVARELLFDPDTTINETANQVGYQNISHFCLLFKRITGKTPRELQMQNQARSDRK